MFCLFIFLFNVPVNNYGYVQTVDSLNYSFPGQA